MSIREFQLVEPLGSGGYGTIWMAKRRRTSDLVAIKVLSRQDTKAKKMLASVHPPPPALRPTPYALHPTPYALRPTPYTLRRPPYALRPPPRARGLHAVRRVARCISLYIYTS